jgi:beta-aspartyl-peptidase (threonine type)
MRVVGARQIVDALARGAEPSEACLSMLADAATVPDLYRSELRCLALTPDGRHGGAASRPGSTYSVITAEDPTVRTLSRTLLAG